MRRVVFILIAVLLFQGVALAGDSDFERLVGAVVNTAADVYVGNKAAEAAFGKKNAQTGGWAGLGLSLVSQAQTGRGFTVNAARSVVEGVAGDRQQYAPPPRHHDRYYGEHHRSDCVDCVVVVQAPPPCRWEVRNVPAYDQYGNFLGYLPRNIRTCE